MAMTIADEVGSSMKVGRSPPGRQSGDESESPRAGMSLTRAGEDRTKSE